MTGGSLSNFVFLELIKN